MSQYGFSAVHTSTTCRIRDRALSLKRKSKEQEIKVPQKGHSIASGPHMSSGRESDLEPLK